jgi:ketosteroid isomerase-like protein
VTWSSLTALGLLILLSSCGQGRDEAVEMERLRLAVKEFHAAINSGDVDRAVGMFTEDVIFMPDGWETITGKERVAEVWTNSITSGFRTKDQKIIELTIGGDLAFEATTQLWTMRSEGQEDQWASSKYVHIWKRRPDGSWKLHLDIWNNNPRSE